MEKPKSRNLSLRCQLDCLLTGYVQLREETRVFHRRLDGLFLVFSVFVLGRMSFALQAPANEFVFCLVPRATLVITN
jgi:hypothetical protein